MEDKIYAILMNQDEITWQSIIYELIKTEEMDPWNINISKLARKYIQTLRRLKEMNLRLSGKVLLAAALLLRIKSTKLLGEDLAEFDRLLAATDEEELYDDFDEDSPEAIKAKADVEKYGLVPRTPQPRKRKVSVYDLVDALEKALHVKQRRILNKLREARTMDLPEKTVDISKLMDELYDEVMKYLGQKDAVAFSELVPTNTKYDKIMTFIPLLHLTNARKIDLRQKKHFDEIWIKNAQKRK